MLKRTMAVAFALFVALAAGSVAAQTCMLGVYSDAAGTDNYKQPTQGEPFNIYVVLFTEDLVDAVSYVIDIPGLGVDVFAQSITYGPSGSGLNVEQPANSGNKNVGLGECVIGFGGLPVVVETTTLFFPFHPQNQRMVTVAPNPVSGLKYADCPGELKTCDVGPGLFLDSVISTTSESWGAVKSLYGN